MSAGTVCTSLESGCFFLTFKMYFMVGIVAYAFNPHTQKAEANWSTLSSRTARVTMRPCLKKREEKERKDHLDFTFKNVCLRAYLCTTCTPCSPGGPEEGVSTHLAASDSL